MNSERLLLLFRSLTNQNFFVTLNRLFITLVWKILFFLGIFNIKIHPKGSDFGKNREKRRENMQKNMRRIKKSKAKQITAALLSLILLISMSSTAFAKTYTRKNWYKQVLNSQNGGLSRKDNKSLWKRSRIQNQKTFFL